MYRALYTAASGMMAQQLNIENISNNLANINTTGYQKTRVDFQDLMYSQMQSEEGFYQVGTGVKTSDLKSVITGGTLKETGNNLDVAIQGNGFFEVKDKSGQTYYTRDGSFTVTDGFLSTKSGLKTSIAIPANATDINIKTDGTVWGTVNKENKQIGSLTMVSFLNPSGLGRVATNTFKESNSSGDKTYGKAGDKNVGSIAVGFIEKSNVNIVEEMTSILMAQRAFEMASKGVQSADEMARMANQMQKG